MIPNWRAARDVPIDILRGTGVIFMVFAYMGYFCFDFPHPYPVQFLGGFAPVIFLFLSGYMLTSEFNEKIRPFSYFFKRSLFLFLLAGIVDVLFWDVYPFLSMNILYPIAVSTLLIYPILSAPESFRVALVIIIFLLTPIFQSTTGYHATPPEVLLFRKGVLVPLQVGLSEWIHRWFIDGWFPLFPFFGFSLLGTFWGKIRNSYQLKIREDHKLFYIFSVTLFCVGLLLLQFETEIAFRGNFSGILFPPGLGYIFFILGVLAIWARVLEIRANSILLWPIRLLGESSLLFYIFTVVIMKKIIEPIREKNSGEFNFSEYLATGVGILVFFLITSLFLRYFKRRMKNPPVLLRLFIGG